MTVPRPIIGILLAAGSGSRFGGDKLLAQFQPGMSIGEAALRRLLPAVDSVIAVVRPGDDALAAAFGCLATRVTACPRAADGLGTSLAWGVRAAPVASGWVIALADMPWIATATIAAVTAALQGGATIAAPAVGRARGHPVGFSARFYGELCALSGDDGARNIVAAHASEIELLATDDAGTLRDIDTAADLR